MENWVQLFDYEGLYEISNYGNIRNSKIIMKQQIDKYGYKYICLTKNGVGKKHKVHRLVLSSFIKHEPNLVCNHIDKNKENNNLTNLEWVTIRENNVHKFLDKNKNVGITFKDNKWYARVQLDKVRIHIGYFKNLNDAIIARHLYLKNNNIVSKY